MKLIGDFRTDRNNKYYLVLQLPEVPANNLAREPLLDSEERVEGGVLERRL
jgi:hypothetical protein